MKGPRKDRSACWVNYAKAVHTKLVGTSRHLNMQIKPAKLVRGLLQQPLAQEGTGMGRRRHREA